MVKARSLVAAGGLGNEARVFLGSDLMWDGPAGLLEPWKIPQVREIPALLRLDRLNGAVCSFEKHAGAIGILGQGQAVTVAGEPREFLDERNLGHAFERRETGDLAVFQSHLARPPAAGGAALAFMEDRHGKTLHRRGTTAKGGDLAATVSLALDRRRRILVAVLHE